MEQRIGLVSREAGKRRRLRIIIPAFPSFNIYSRVARVTTALGPVTVATVAREMEGWDVEVIDENNYQRSGPATETGLPDHEALQQLRPADVVGLYGGLTSTIPAQAFISMDDLPMKYSRGTPVISVRAGFRPTTYPSCRRVMLITSGMVSKTE